MVYLSAERKTLSMTKNYVLQNEEKIKTFPDKQKMREFITIGNAL